MAGVVLAIFQLLQKLLCSPQQSPQQEQQQQQAWQSQQQQYGPNGQWAPGQQQQGQQGGHYPPPQQQQQWPTPAQGAWQQGPPPQQPQPQPWQPVPQHQQQQQQQQQHHAQSLSPPPHHGHGHSPSPKPHSHTPSPRPNGDQQHASDPHYLSLRNQANAEGDKMGDCFDKAHEAHERGDGRRAKELSEEGHQHQRKMEELNREAAEWIFTANNQESPEGTIDLHGLYVQEAIDRTEAAIRSSQSKGQGELRVIVGKGLHSKGHVAKIKPAIEQLMAKYNLAAELDPQNEGVLVVHLGGAAQGRRGMDADEVTRRLDSDEKCVIM